MSRNTLLKMLLLLATAAFVTAVDARVANAQKWATDMFEHTSHDFGVVARGAKVQHVFTLENIYEEDAHVSAIRSSCTCTTPEISKRSLKTWEKVEIVARIDTHGFLGRKDATITVVFDKPFPGEVQLHTQCYIRRDVVIQPGAILFGSVVQGSSPEQKAAISYAGRDNWKIEKVECANENIVAEVVETSRGPGQVSYDLKVRLKEGAPAGYIRDHVMLVTNDPGIRSSRVPVAVEATVVSAVTVRPSLLSLGIVKSDEPARGRLVVQAKTPFRILSATSDDPRFTCTAPLPEKAASVHLIPITFTGNSLSGKISSQISITTDVPSCKKLSTPVEVWIKPPVTAKTAPSGPVEL